MIANYSLQAVEAPLRKKQQSALVPIIDIVRHGETKRKQHRLGALHKTLDVGDHNAALDDENLDLTDEGIRTIQLSAGQLLGRIARDKEVILIVSSRSWRAHSSALVIEDMLRKAGIRILNLPRQFKFFWALNELLAHEKKLEAIRNTGELIPLEQTFAIEALGFYRFLRHMNNIYKWLKPETMLMLKDKRLRIICTTHQEITLRVIEDCFGWTAEPQGKGQILEIVPTSQLCSNSSVATRVELLPNKQRPVKCEAKVILRKFSH